MARAPKEQKKRNLEFYKRWRLQGENIYKLLIEYGFSLTRAYQIKEKVEKKYPDLLKIS